MAGGPTPRCVAFALDRMKAEAETWIVDLDGSRWPEAVGDGEGDKAHAHGAAIQRGGGRLRDGATRYEPDGLGGGRHGETRRESTHARLDPYAIDPEVEVT